LIKCNASAAVVFPSLFRPLYRWPTEGTKRPPGAARNRSCRIFSKGSTSWVPAHARGPAPNTGQFIPLPLKSEGNMMACCVCVGGRGMQ
jgi:hypothetical protein